MTDQVKVAIVEDQAEIRESLRVLIQGSAGFVCEYTYVDAESALMELPSRDVNVVLMDIHLPGMNGIECMMKLKEKMPSTQFMMCTVYDDDENIFKALESGANGYILKRTSPVQILEAIRDLSQGGSPMSSEIARKVVINLRRKDHLNTKTEILTQRENEILDFLSKGFLYKEIAAELFISKETVKKHIHNIYAKLQVQTRTEALNKAFRQ